MRKFKCIKSYESGTWLTKGKIYTEDNGRFEYDDGWVSHGFDYNVSHFGADDTMSNYLEEVFDEEIKEDKKVNKFKVGDVVKIICNSCGHCFNVGDIVELYEDCGGNFRGRTSKNEYKANHILEDDMEKFIKPTLDNDTMIEKLDGEYCSGRLCGDCIFSGNDCGWSDMSDDELLSAYNLAFGNDQSNLMNNSESTPKYDLKKDKIAVLCDTDKKLTELYKLFNSKPNTSVALVFNPSKLYVSWDSESNELTWDSIEYHEINHYTLLTFEEFMNGFVAKNPITFTITTSDSTTTLTDGTHTTSINRYYTDKHDDMIALEEVVKKYKSEIEEMGHKSKEKHLFDDETNCDYGVVGTLTILTDSVGRKLFVGDVVKVYNKDGSDDGFIDLVCHDNEDGDFIMGCACATRNNSKKEYNYLKEMSYEDISNYNKIWDSCLVIK